MSKLSPREELFVTAISTWRTLDFVLYKFFSSPCHQMEKRLTKVIVHCTGADNNACFAFLKGHSRIGINYLVWSSAQLLRIFLRTYLKPYKHVHRVLESYFEHLKTTNVPLYNVLLLRLINFFEDVLENFDLIFKQRIRFVPSAFEIESPDGKAFLCENVFLFTHTDQLLDMVSCFYMIVEKDQKFITRFSKPLLKRLVNVFFKLSTISRDDLKRNLLRFCITASDFVSLFSNRLDLETIEFLLREENPCNSKRNKCFKETASVLSNVINRQNNLSQIGPCSTSFIEILLGLLKHYFEFEKESPDIAVLLSIIERLLEETPPRSEISSFIYLSKYLVEQEALVEVFARSIVLSVQSRLRGGELDYEAVWDLKSLSGLWNKLLVRLQEIINTLSRGNKKVIQFRTSELTTLVRELQLIVETGIRCHFKLPTLDITAPMEIFGQLGVQLLDILLVLILKCTARTCKEIASSCLLKVITTFFDHKYFNLAAGHFALACVLEKGALGFGEATSFQIQSALLCLVPLSDYDKWAQDVFLKIQSITYYLITNPNTASLVIEILPILLVLAKGKTLRFFLYILIEILKDQIKARQLLLSPQSGHIIPCVLDGFCTYERAGPCDWTVKCCVCRGDSKKVYREERRMTKTILHLVGKVFKDTILSSNSESQIALLKILPQFLSHCKSLRKEKNIEEILSIVRSPSMSLSSLHLVFLKIAKSVMYQRNGSPSFLGVKSLVKSIFPLILKAVTGSSGWQDGISFLVEIAIRICQVPKQWALVIGMKIIFLLSPNILLLNSTIIQDAFYKIMMSHNLTRIRILTKYQEEISKVLVMSFFYNPASETCGLRHILDLIAELFNCKSSAFLESYCTTSMVSFLSTSFDENVSLAFFNQLALIFDLPLKDLLIIYFEDIFSSVLFHSDKRKLESLLKLLSEHTNESLATLVYFCYKSLICKVLNYSHDPKVLNLILAGTQQSNAPLAESDYISTVEQHVLGYLTYIDTKLVSKKASDITLKKCLSSLPGVMCLIGSSGVTNIRIKLLDTLCIGLPPYYEEFSNLALKAWAHFIYCVDVVSIGPFLSKIFFSLLPLLKVYPKDVSLMLHYIVVKNGKVLRTYLPQLYFVPRTSLPLMVKVWSVIRSALRSLIKTYEDDIRMTISFIDNDCVELRLHGLKRLFKLISTHSSTLHDLILKHDVMPNLIIEIIDCLTSNLHHSDVKVRELCGKCIGELGAIDPSRIERRVITEDPHKNKMYDIKSDQFTFFLVNTLVKGLQNAKDPVMTNTFASGIQEILKLYFQDDAQKKSTFVDKFHSNLKDVLLPLLQARYRYLYSHYRKKYPSPIFGSYLGLNTLEWAYSWTTQLITFMPDGFVKKVFDICVPSMRISIETLLSFLPYVLYETMMVCSKRHLVLIAKEFKAVIKYAQKKKCPSMMRFRFTDFNEINEETSQTTNFDEAKCISIIFDLLDFLNNCLSSLPSGSGEKKNIVTDFLKKFSNRTISHKSYQQNDYSRSLLYMERDLIDKKGKGNCLRPLRNIYSKLNEPDGIMGVMSTVQSLHKMEDIVLKSTVLGKVEEALIGYGNLAERYGSEEFHRGLIQCYLNMDEPHVALQATKTIMNHKWCTPPVLYNELAEVLYTNMMFDETKELMDSLNTTSYHGHWSWGIDLCSLFNCIVHCESSKFHFQLSNVRRHLIDILSVTSDDSSALYRKGYRYLVMLHALSEVEKYASVLETEPSLWTETLNSSLGKDMDLRLELLQNNAYAQHRILSVRRVCLGLLKSKAQIANNQLALGRINAEIGNSWIKSAQTARKNGNYQKAYAMIEMAEPFKPLTLFIERAKLYREKGDTSNAVAVLEQGLSTHFSSSIGNNASHDFSWLCAEAKLLLAKYHEEKMDVDYHNGFKFYNEAVEIYTWEEGYVNLAQYMLKIAKQTLQSPQSKAKRNYTLVIASYFGKSLQYGSNYIYQSMPQMLSLWLEFGAELSRDMETIPNIIHERLMTMSKFNDLIEYFVDNLPAYKFMTALSQIMSRICHPNTTVYRVIKKIIMKLIISFPQQAMWMFIAVCKTPVAEYKKRSDEVLKDPKITSNKSLMAFITSFSDVIVKFIELCKKDVPKAGCVVSMKGLARMIRLKLQSGVQIMLPAQKFRTISLPTYKQYENEADGNDHCTFPSSVVYMVDLRNEVRVLTSLQKPKQVHFIGSDGETYPLMFKDLDDLRLDSRIMEFNSIVNMYLRRDPLARDRHLHIRTYSVVPLNHDCGIIEWVPNVTTYRNIIVSIYKSRGMYMSMQEVKNITPIKQRPLKERLDVFLNVLIPKHPPVLHDWFFFHFLSPDKWYRARTSYVRTAAVMSIVGYIVGLGDRHGENIMVDTLRGDLVHVDFNCLFNKGENFEYPELVPFRLTHNMVCAMGPTGIEGTYVHSCEITNRIMRDHMNELLAVIEPFLYDPQIDSKKQQVRKKGEGEFTDDKAQKRINRVQKRLEGKIPISKEFSQTLSVEGQTRYLINEATDPNNLCQMYFGWSAFL